MSESLDLFYQALLDCIAALPITIFLTVVSVGCGLLLAVPFAVIAQKKKTVAAKIVNGFVYFFTGTHLCYSEPTADNIYSLLGNRQF